MENLVVYKCNKKYKPNPKKVIKKILSKIPDEYLAGVKEVTIIDSSQSHSGVYISNAIDSNEKYSKIEVNMGFKDFSGTPLFSILMLNIAFIELVKKNYTDVTGNVIEKGVGFDWISLGVWQPINSILRMYNFVVTKNRLFASINKKIDRILLKILEK